MKRAVFFSKSQHDYKCDIDFIHSSINKKLILRDLRFRHHIACFFSISPTKIIPSKATALFCVSEQHDSV